jgi:Ion channel
MSGRKLPFQEGRHRLSVAHLLIAIVVMFVVLPFVDNVPYGRLVDALVFTAVLLAGVNAVGGRQRTLIGATMLVMPALITRWIDHIFPGTLPLLPSVVAAIAFVVFVIWHLLRFVMSSPTVTPEVLCAAISIYLLFAVAWAFLYTLVAVFAPDAFAFVVPSQAGSTMAGFTALYFSLETLTTVAFGDIVPVSNVARMLTVVESTAGVFYVTVLIARLVGLYSNRKQQSL